MCLHFICFVFTQVMAVFTFYFICVNQIYYALVYTGNGWKEQTWECSHCSIYAQIRSCTSLWGEYSEVLSGENERFFFICCNSPFFITLTLNAGHWAPKDLGKNTVPDFRRESMVIGDTSATFFLSVNLFLWLMNIYIYKILSNASTNFRLQSNGTVQGMKSKEN